MKTLMLTTALVTATAFGAAAQTGTETTQEMNAANGAQATVPAFLSSDFTGMNLYTLDSDTAADLIPGAIGYRSVTDPSDSEIKYESGAKRFEVGSTTPVAHVGLVEAIDAIEEVGIETIETRIESLTDRLKAGIESDRLLSPQRFESGLVTIAADDPETTVERLAEEGIVIRALPFPEAVRVSVHAVSTEQEIDTVVDQLQNR